MPDPSGIVRSDDVVAPMAAGRMDVSAAGQTVRSRRRSSVRPLVALVLPVLWQLRAARGAGPGPVRRWLGAAALIVAAPLVAAVAIVAVQWPYGSGWVMAWPRL